MIVTIFPHQIPEGYIEDKHINGKLSGNVIKLSNDFKVNADGSISLNINIVSDEDLANLKKLVTNGEGDKFLADNGEYRELSDLFMKVYHNFTEFSTSDNFLTVFNEMEQPSILLSEISNDNSYPYPTGKLEIYKLNEQSAVISYLGLNQVLYTRIINKGQLSDWHSTEDSTVYISKILDITGNTWQTTYITENDLDSGSYHIQLKFNNDDTYTGVFSWDGNKDTEGREIMLNHSGTTTMEEVIYLRVYGTMPVLQINSNKGYNKAQCDFTFKKII